MFNLIGRSGSRRAGVSGVEMHRRDGLTGRAINDFDGQFAVGLSWVECGGLRLTPVRLGCEVKNDPSVHF
jgi:hypothetical protein